MVERKVLDERSLTLDEFSKEVRSYGDRIFVRAATLERSAVRYGTVPFADLDEAQQSLFIAKWWKNGYYPLMLIDVPPSVTKKDEGKRYRSSSPSRTEL